MTDSELRLTLRELGIDHTAGGVVALLPLVQIAWADGTVHPNEREVILTFAKERGHAEPAGLRALETWLSYTPSPAYIAKGTAAWHALAARSGEKPADLLGVCESVAHAAGTLFRRIEPVEREVLGAVAEALAVRDLPGLDAEDTASGWSDEEPTGIAHVHTPHLPPVEGAPGLARLEDGLEVRVAFDGRLTLGRGRENTLQLPHDGQISRQHCEIFSEGGRVYVRDLGSLNGTWVRGERVVERELFGGEDLVVGDTALRWRSAEPVAEEGGG